MTSSTSSRLGTYNLSSSIMSVCLLTLMFLSMSTYSKVS
nr:TPA_asm: m26.5 sORF 1 [Murid betaherpesvirus 1]DBA07752.1 TPA_asm: m26.5 sORF 1 [Murid betaherpesvirus 1]